MNAKKPAQSKINLANPIAQGRTADVYPWGEAHILKLYREWCPAEWVGHEAQVARTLTQAGVPTPAVGEMIRLEGRLGIIYERISGHSMLDDLRRFPLGIFQHGRALAELQAQIHRQTIPALNTYQNGLERAIQSAPALPENLRQKALAQLATLPARETLC
ncbi:MAG TPA: hypothetical protein VLH85_08955, partial [Levilinea sp.]|nr:hypothetical protein [Levilinea sp.]